ncbi:MAG: STN domain-containing protein [Planctomycetes bacterium]|nr:STN domain-containing protein [Planctomycetota bacterium]
MFVGKTVDCPDCSESFTIVADGARHLSARKPVEGEASTTVGQPIPKRGNDSERSRAGAKKRPAQSRDGVAKRSSQRNRSPVRSRERLAKVQSLLKNPLTIAWIAATSVALVIVIAVLNRANDDSGKTVSDGNGGENKSADREGIVQKNPPREKSISARDRMRLNDRKKPRVAVKPLPGKKTPARKPPPRKQKVSVIPRFIGNPVKAKKPKFRGEKVRRIDVRAKLSQPILRFHQPQLKPFPDLLDEVREMSGIPIRYDREQIAAALNQRVSLSLEKTTVKGILAALLSKVGLTYKIEAAGIRVLPKD